MFHLLGKTVTRLWPLCLGGWIVLLAVTWLAAPAWEVVAQDKEFAFLPEETPSRRGEEVFAKAFPDEQLASNVVLVLQFQDTNQGRLDQVKKFVEDILEPRLRQIAEETGGIAAEATPTEEPLFPGDAVAPSPPRPEPSIARIRTPSAPGTGALLVSADGKALLVVVELTKEFLSRRNWLVITRIENLISELVNEKKAPPGVELFLTGSAVIGRDQTRAQLQSAEATELFTVLLVVALLLLIYRAPLVALIPLATVFLAVQIALHLLAILAQAGYVALFQGIQIYITILTYGAGVDYCLFLTARYKEELDRGARSHDAVARALGQVGAVLAASAGTVMGGTGMMVFAEFGKFRQAGLAIPLSLFIVLCATLTFTAAFLCLTGRWAFWPRVPRGGSGDRLLAVAPTGRGPQLYQPGAFQRGWEKMGQLLLGRPATIWLTTLALLMPFALAAVLLSNQLTYDLIGNLPNEAPSVTGTRVLQDHFPAGLMGPVTVLLVNPQIDFSTPKGQGLLGQLTERVQERKEELGLADLRSLATPLGITQAAKDAFSQLSFPEEALQEALRVEARAHYTTDFGERAKIGARLDLILDQNPFSRRRIDTLDRVERLFAAALPPELQQQAQLFFLGPTASLRDLRAVVERDQIRLEILVLASVFGILLLLLRRFVIALYLILSVLVSYYATLGVAFAVFWLLDPAGFSGIDWKVAIFLFTILIAVGEDYNIFLITRIHEEQQRWGLVRGVTEALARTGPIISSCGLIMAGTFAALLAGSLTEMKQLGFALAFGVLVDTFVVRPILVPSFLLLLYNGRFRLPNWLQRELAAPAKPESSRPSSSSP